MTLTNPMVVRTTCLMLWTAWGRR